jgi:nitrile hydratase
LDGIHDLGGRQGFGPVVRELDEPAFHERWEASVFTMMRRLVGAGVIVNTDQFRYAIERIDPVAYLSHTYYGRWLGGIENLLVEAEVVDTAAVTERAVSLGGAPGDLVAARPDSQLPRPSPGAPGAARPLDSEARFQPGDRVRTKSAPFSGHTRLPAYARGRRGEVIRHQGTWVLPDTNAVGEGEHPQHLYCVRFEGVELWGEEAEPGQSVLLDLFECYLEPELAGTGAE